MGAAGDWSVGSGGLDDGGWWWERSLGVDGRGDGVDRGWFEQQQHVERSPPASVSQVRNNVNPAPQIRDYGEGFPADSIYHTHARLDAFRCQILVVKWYIVNKHNIKKPGCPVNHSETQFRVNERVGINYKLNPHSTLCSSTLQSLFLPRRPMQEENIIV